METPQRIGKYEVISRVAAGGFGVIFKGWDPFIKRPVAIKMCATPDEEVRKRFHQEAQFVGNLVHRNITLVFDFGVENDVPFIVQEFLTGFDLDQLMRADALTDPKTVVAVLLQVCEGLDFAHHRGIIHRDIKPSNIRVLEDGTVKILDFGIAKSLEGGTKLTQTGIALGTAGYLAPEQIQGGTVDPRTDIFALGVVAYELVTGVRPFEGKTLSNVLYKILNDHPPPPASISELCSEELGRIIERCMAKDPKQRYQTVGELFDELRQLSAADKSDAELSREITTGVLRRAVMRLDRPASGAIEPPTTDISGATMTDADGEIEHPPDLEETDARRRSPALTVFLSLVGLLAAGAGALYFSPELQHRVFGPAGPPWIPTPTSTPTVTPTASPSPTAVDTPTATPTATPEPTRGPLAIRLVVDPPAVVTVDGRPFGSGKTSVATVRLMPGSHTFTVSLPGYPEQTFKRTVTDDTQVISLTLEVGLLTVMVDASSAPPGGVAYLDGDTLGPVPLVGRTVPAGEHELVVRWPNDPRAYRSMIVVPRLPSPPLVVPPVAPPND